MPSDAPSADQAASSSARPRFGRTLGLTVAGTVVPGLGLIAAGKRVAGAIVLSVFVGLIAAVGIWAAIDWRSLVAVGVQPGPLRILAVALAALGVLWVGVIVASHLSLRGGSVSSTQRAIGGVLVGLLAFAVAAPMAVAARLSYDQAGVVAAVFKSDKDTKSATRPTLATDATKKGEAPDPWKDKARLNILLLGGDAGRTRTGTRTDSVILASIDTRTGDTALFSLPRNTTHMPFPENSALHRYYPNGFTDGNSTNAEFFLNAMYQNVPASVPKDVLGETDDLGADALKLSVGAALGLKVDYYVLINLAGFEQLVDALGGITVNINTYVPIGGNTDRHIAPDDYLKPGPNQKLDGREALWYARGRYGSTDYDRMDRQRCVISAIIDQANPANVLARYEDIARAGKDIVKTDIPQEVLPLMVDLSLKVKDGNVRSIVFKTGSDGWVSGNPNFAQARARVKAALTETASDTPTKKPSSSGSGSKSSSSSTESEDVTTSCAYQPKVAATAQPAR